MEMLITLSEFTASVPQSFTTTQTSTENRYIITNGNYPNTNALTSILSLGFDSSVDLGSTNAE